MALDLQLTYADIEKRLRSFTLDDVSDDIDDMIEEETACLEPTVVRIGIEPEDVTDTENRRLWLACRLVVILRVTAETMVGFSHEYGKAAERRERKADEIERRIIDMPEAFLDDFDPTKHMGAMAYAGIEEGLDVLGVERWLGIDWSCMRGA